MLRRRSYSVPEKLALLGYAGGVLAIVYPTISQATGTGVPCPLRTVTGIPCPVCGLTTGATALVSGEFGQAWSATPVVFGMAILGIVMLPILALRLTGRLALPAPARQSTRRLISVLAMLAAAASWLYQLQRFELI